MCAPLGWYDNPMDGLDPWIEGTPPDDEDEEEEYDEWDYEEEDDDED